MEITRNLRRRLVATSMLPLILAAVAPATAAGEKSAPSFLPVDLPLVAVLRDGDRQVAAFQTLLDQLEFTDSPAYRSLEANPQLVQARIGAYGVAAMAGSDPWTAASVLLGREVAIGIAPGGGQGPRVAIVAVPRDAKALDRLLGALHRMAGLERDGKPDEDRSKVVDGVRVFNAGKDFYHCRLGDALVLCNHRELMRQIVAIHSANGASVCESSAYRDAVKTVPSGAAAWAVADLAAVRKLLGPERELPAQIGNPLGGFVAGGWWHAIRNADSVVAWATPGERALHVELQVTAREPLPATHRGFAPARPTGLDWPAAKLPRYVGQIAITRDWAGLFGEREGLLSLTAAGQIVQFNNTVTTLLGQMDFTEDLLPIVSGPTRLIVAAQNFASLPYDPTPRLPAFALVAPLRFPEASSFAKRLFSATQVAVSALSLIAAQEGNPPYLIDTDRHRGYRMVVTEYGDPDEMETMRQQMVGDSNDPAAAKPAGQAGDAASPATMPDRKLTGVRYNFAPAAALVEDQYVIATSTEMLKDVIDVIAETKASGGKSGTVRDVPPDSLELRIAAIVGLLRENYSELVTNAMLEKDQPRAQAERELDTLLGVLDFGERLSLAAQQSERGFSARLEVTLTKPERTAPRAAEERP